MVVFTLLRGACFGGPARKLISFPLTGSYPLQTQTWSERYYYPNSRIQRRNCYLQERKVSISSTLITSPAHPTFPPRQPKSHHTSTAPLETAPNTC